MKATIKVISNGYFPFIALYYNLKLFAYSNSILFNILKIIIFFIPSFTKISFFKNFSNVWLSNLSYSNSEFYPFFIF